MQLDKIEAVVRPRTSWEAIDLGFCMMQRWMWDFYRIWLVLTLPLFIAVYLLAALLTDNPDIWALAITWWLKPVYDRIILHYFSHALFGERITLRQMLNALPRLLLKTQLLLGLTLYRLSPVRSFTLPIWQLEGSKGTILQQRFKVLQQHTRGTATWLTIICLHFQALIVLLLYTLIFLFLPENTDLETTYFLLLEDSTFYLGIDLILDYIALSLIEPFYVTAGFALYLNRRTHLEGWDIELTFRQIRKKVQALQMTVVISFITVMISMFYVTDLSAQSQQIEQHIEEILQQPEFDTTEQQHYWKYIGDERESTSIEADSEWTLPFSWISIWANLFEILLWIAITSAIAWLIYKALQSPLLQQWVNQSETYQPNVNSELIQAFKNVPLPDDIAQQAWKLWEQNQHRQAMSLLYRGTLQHLQQQYEIAIYDSATENECVRMVSRTQSTDLSHYFSRLTRAWQSLAYGKRSPDSQEVQQLCEQWSQFFHCTPDFN